MARLYQFTAFLVSDRKTEFRTVWALSQADAMNRIYETTPDNVMIRSIRQG